MKSQENLNKLKKHLAHKWEFIVMQAEEQVTNATDSTNREGLL
jgi:Regulator of G-protein signalling DHEX domain